MVKKKEINQESVEKKLLNNKNITRENNVQSEKILDNVSQMPVINKQNIIESTNIPKITENQKPEQMNVVLDKNTDVNNVGNENNQTIQNINAENNRNEIIPENKNYTTGQ